MKDNKPLVDPLADRLTFSEGEHNTFKLSLVHCRESDSGTYIARATNGFENATCTAQLIVAQCKKNPMKAFEKLLMVEILFNFSDA